MANANNTEILAVAHALIAGARGAKGGAASKDSVFGVALIRGNVVTFGGRRGGTLRYKTERKADLEKVMAKFAGKLTGTPFGKGVEGVYVDVTASADRETLFPNLAAVINAGFYKAMGARKINNRATAKPAKKVAVVEAATEATA